VLEVDRFGEMGIESRRRGATTILLLGVAAHGDQTDLRRLLAYAPPDLVPIELGQSDVQENHLRRKGPHGFEGLATGVGGARLVSFEGEQHGFRRAENIKRTLEAELYFYSKVFKFDLAEPVEPVEIENL